MRSWRYSLLAAAGLAGLALVACGGSTATPTADSPPPPTQEDEGLPTPQALPTPQDLPTAEPPSDTDAPPSDLARPPLIRLVVDGTPQEGYQGSYCWTDPGAGAGLCVDKIPPEFDSAVSLPAGDPIRLQLDAPLPDSVTLSLSSGVFGNPLVMETLPGAETLEWPAQVEPGQYVLGVFATWEQQGDVVYLFSITLE